MISNKIGCKYCTVQRYCENMIYCEAIQYFGSFHFIHSLVDGLHSVLLPLRLIYCLVQYPRLLMGYPLRLAKIAFTHKIWVYPWRIGSYPWRIWVDPWRILWKLRLHPQRIPYFFYSTPKEILNFYNLPLENSMVPQPGGADIKCNSPIFFVSQKKKTFWSLYCRTARILTLPENTP